MKSRTKRWMLTPRQAAFTEAYILHGRAAKAAREAGYAEGSAHVSASRLLRSRRVQEALAARGAEAKVQFDVSRDGLVKELLRAVDLARDQMNPLAMVVATRELGRIMGYYTNLPVDVDS